MKNVNKKRYFTLLERYEGLWTIQAGSYSKYDVSEEKDHIVDTVYGIDRNDLKIITTDDTQESIDKVVNELNNQQTKGQ